MAAEVLIVDDDVANLTFLRDWLLRYGDRFKVVTAQDGVEALEVLRQREIAVVVTDLRMPRLDGFGLLIRMADQHPQIPKIVMTSLSSPVTQYQAERNDILDYLVKPVSPELLARRILSVLDSQGESGFLKGISISSFAQLVDLEQKTCTITVRHAKNEQTGVLYFREGRLINAKLGELGGQDAACRILAWPDVRITIKDTCPEMPDSIRRKIQDVLMMCAQIVDEAGVHDAPGVAATPPSPAPATPDAPAPPEGGDGELAKLDHDELMDRALDSFRNGLYEDAKRCWLVALDRSPGSKMIEHNLRVLEQKMKRIG